MKVQRRFTKGLGSPYENIEFVSRKSEIRNKASGVVALKPPSEYLRRFWYDTIVHDVLSLEFLAQRVQTDRLVLGTDESFPPHEADPLAFLRKSRLTAEDLTLIAERNPRALFRLPE